MPSHQVYLPSSWLEFFFLCHSLYAFCLVCFFLVFYVCLCFCPGHNKACLIQCTFRLLSYEFAICQYHVFFYVNLYEHVSLYSTLNNCLMNLFLFLCLLFFIWILLLPMWPCHHRIICKCQQTTMTTLASEPLFSF